MRPHIGSMSESWMPFTLVLATPNSPRYSTDASGFGSHMSMWLGPPRIHRMMTEGCRVCAARSGDQATTGVARASLRSRSASVSPAVPSMPALTKSRRDRRRLARNSGQPCELEVGEGMLQRLLLALGRVSPPGGHD